MEAALIVLIAVNLALTLTVLVMIFRGGLTGRLGTRPMSEEASSTALQGVLQHGLQSMHGAIRNDLSVQRGEIAQHLSIGQQQLDTRLSAAFESQAAELAREREARVLANRDLQHAVREELEKIRVSNELKLEKMRETVDEKLQGTLEKRLGKSFSLVSERLEQVQKGLGEMQTLASDVGGLKRVLTNVKNRGGWGEVQLSRQLEDILTPEQYAENVAIRPDTSDRVEYAVRLPGRDEHDRPVYLPIDSKFPQEDYERLLDAQEAGDAEAIEAMGRALERAIIAQAKLIARKYIAPPFSTDFAIMYLPTEGLFAEVVRTPGLASRLQNEHKIIVTGPTTLMSLLGSLQMGFRTLAIERRTSEVWEVLSAAKHEFQKYGDVWDKLGKQLQTAQNTVQEAGRRTRAVERKLRNVESIETAEADELMGEQLEAMLGGDLDAAADLVGPLDGGSAGSSS